MRTYLTAGLAACLLTLASSHLAFAQGNVISLPGTEWAGSENLKGFGNLRFKFMTGGEAIMVDAQHALKGSYSQNGAQVAIRFGKSCVYSGTIQGQTMSGTAQEGKFTWSWNVQLQQGGVQPAAGPASSVIPMPPANPPAVANPPAASGSSAFTQTPAAPAAGPINNQSLPDYLRRLGYQVEIVPLNNGGSLTQIVVRKDTWTVVIEVDSQKNGKGVWLKARLGQLPSTASTQALVRLLQANHTIAPTFFTYQAVDQRLYLLLESPNAENANVLRGDINLLVQNVIQTASLWNPANLAPPAQPFAGIPANN
jgi:predicted RNA-binding protein YlxR (DUF448 family)